jgi:uncharacterized protein (DUF1778 family)
MARSDSDPQIRTNRLEARIAPAVLALVKRAAESQGRSVSDFVVEAAREAAERALAEASIIRLAAQEQQRFVSLLLEPRPQSAAMKRAKAAHAKLFGE